MARTAQLLSRFDGVNFSVRRLNKLMLDQKALFFIFLALLYGFFVCDHFTLSV